MQEKLVDVLIIQKQFGPANPQDPAQSGTAELTLDHAEDAGTIQAAALSERPGGGRSRRGAPLALQPAGGDVGVGTAAPDARLHVVSGGGFHAPQLLLEQSTKNNYARLRLNGARRDAEGKGPGTAQADAGRFWDMAAGGRANALNFYSRALAESGRTNGNAVTITEEGRVGVGAENPAAELEVNGKVAAALAELTGGEGLAGSFPAGGAQKIEPGTVLVIDPARPGALKPGDAPYDRKVAGIAAGAGGLRPGLLLRGASPAEASVELTLSGKAYCKAEADSAPIEPGDPLTTSTIPGHAMKSQRPDCHGAIIGKAMTGLKKGRGLVLVLVNPH